MALEEITRNMIDFVNAMVVVGALCGFVGFFIGAIVGMIYQRKWWKI